MPHLSIQYTENLASFDVAGCLAQANAALARSGHFKEFDIKSRAFPVSEFQVGAQDAGRAFISAQLSILSGRSPEVRGELSALVLSCLERQVLAQAGLVVQISVEVFEIEHSSYVKTIVGT